jgi:hypothetical protein
LKALDKKGNPLEKNRKGSNEKERGKKKKSFLTQQKPKKQKRKNYFEEF